MKTTFQLFPRYCLFSLRKNMLHELSTGNWRQTAIQNTYMFLHMWNWISNKMITIMVKKLFWQWSPNCRNRPMVSAVLPHCPGEPREQHTAGQALSELRGVCRAPPAVPGTRRFLCKAAQAAPSSSSRRHRRRCWQRRWSLVFGVGKIHYLSHSPNLQHKNSLERSRQVLN